jgi:hypothetical protein
MANAQLGEAATKKRANGAVHEMDENVASLEEERAKPTKKSGGSPFDDFEALRAKNTAAFAGETEISSSIRLGKPPKNLYFRCPTAPDMYVPAQVWTADDDNRKIYYVEAGLWDLEDLQGGLRPVILSPWMGADGSLGLWPVSASDTSEWAESARHAVAEAKKGWIRIQSDTRAQRYRIFYPHSPIQSRSWPGLALPDFCKSAFGSRVVITEDDQLIRQLRNIEAVR